MRVTDNDTPPLYDEEQITVTVTNASPTLLNTNFSKPADLAAINLLSNPADDIVNIALSSPAGHVFVTVTDMKGTVLITQEYNSAPVNYIVLNVIRLSRGFYMLQLHTGKTD